MHVIGLLLLVGLFGGGTALYARRRVAGVVAHGSPRAARGARRIQHQATAGRMAAGGKAAEIWAAAHSADWLERRRIARARSEHRYQTRLARPSVPSRLGRAARFAGTAAAARVRNRRAAHGPAVITPPAAPAPAAPAERKTPTMSTPGATSGNSHGGGAGGGADPIWARPGSGSGGGNAAPGAGADLFTAVQQLTSAAMSGGLRSKQRATAALSDGLDYMASALEAFARRLSEPDQHYPPAVWEAISRSAAHLKAASSAAGEGASAVGAIAAMTVGDLADSATQAPHHDELNAA